MTEEERLAQALHAVSVARDVERFAEGSEGQPAGPRREKRHPLSSTTDARILEAAREGATTTQLAEALGLSTATARKRPAGRH